MCVPPNTHLCSRIARTILFRREGRSHSKTRDTGQATTKAALTFSDCALTSIPAQECMRQSSSLVKGKAALTLAWMACTLLAAPIPAQELTQATLFPLKRRPRSHFALSPTCSDRTRTAPLKNLDSSSRSGGLYIGDGVRGWTLASIPAQEFGEGTRPDDGRSTTSCSSRQRRSRATSPRATTTHRRVRLFATLTSLLRPGR